METTERAAYAALIRRRWRHTRTLLAEMLCAFWARLRRVTARRVTRFAWRVDARVATVTALPLLTTQPALPVVRVSISMPPPPPPPEPEPPRGSPFAPYADALGVDTLPIIHPQLAHLMARRLGALWHLLDVKSPNWEQEFADLVAELALAIGVDRVELALWEDAAEIGGKTQAATLPIPALIRQRLPTAGLPMRPAPAVPFPQPEPPTLANPLDATPEQRSPSFYETTGLPDLTRFDALEEVDIPGMEPRDGQQEGEDDDDDGEDGDGGQRVGIGA